MVKGKLKPIDLGKADELGLRGIVACPRLAFCPGDKHRAYGLARCATRGTGDPCHRVGYVYSQSLARPLVRRPIS